MSGLGLVGIIVSMKDALTRNANRIQQSMRSLDATGLDTVKRLPEIPRKEDLFSPKWVTPTRPWVGHTKPAIDTCANSVGFSLKGRNISAQGKRVFERRPGNGRPPQKAKP